MAGYSHGIPATIEQESISCQAGHYRSFQGSHLGETDDYPSGDVHDTFQSCKDYPGGVSFTGKYQLDFSMIYDSGVWYLQ